MSDNPAAPPGPELLKKRSKQLRGLSRPHPRGDIDPVVQPCVRRDIVKRTRCACLRVKRAEDQPRYPCEDDRAHAHEARLKGDVEGRAGEPPSSELPGRGPYGYELGVS